MAIENIRGHWAGMVGTSSFACRAGSMPDNNRASDAKELLDSDRQATKLVLSLLNYLGFEQVLTKQGLVWELKRNGHSLRITTNDEVYINQSYRCIRAKSYDLPFADLIFAKLISLLTEVRTKISTLNKEDLNVLEQLFPLEETRFKISKFQEEKGEKDVWEKQKAIAQQGSNPDTTNQ